MKHTTVKTRFNSERVREFRTQRGWTQYDLCQEVRKINPDVMVTPAAISKLENCHQNPELETALALAGALGVDVNDLLS